MILEGYFDNLKKAERAISELKRNGINAHLDLNKKTLDNKNTITNLSGTGTNTSLSDLVLNSGNHNIDIEKAPLFASDPNVNDLAGFDEIINTKHKILVEANNTNNEILAMQIIEKIAGSVINTDS